VRAEAGELAALLGTLSHRPTWLAVQAERAVSRGLGGNCSMPLAAYAAWHGDRLCLDAALGDAGEPSRPLLRTRVDAVVDGDDAALRLGAAAAAQLRAVGADAYLDAG